MRKNILATYTAAALAITVIFPTVSSIDKAINPFAEPVGIVARKTDDPSTVFVGFIIGHQTDDMANHPEAQGYNTISELQTAFKHFLISNRVMIAIGEHAYGVKRLFDSMLGNQVIDLEFRQQIEVVDMVGALQASNPNLSTIQDYAEEHGLHLPTPKSLMSRTERIALVYTDALNRFIGIGAAPTAANMMPYKQPMMQAA